MLEDTNGFVYKDSGGTSIELNTFVYPFSKQLDIVLDDARYNPRPRMQHDGEWPTYAYEGGMDIVVEGDIFGSDSDTYFANRLALVARLRYRPTPAVRYDGTVLIDFAGATEVWQTDVTVRAFSAPLVTGQDAGPGRSAYMITFHSTNPYFTGVDTDTVYYYS